MAIFDKPENTLNLGPFFYFFGTLYRNQNVGIGHVSIIGVGQAFASYKLDMIE